MGMMATASLPLHKLRCEPATHSSYLMCTPMLRQSVDAGLPFGLVVVKSSRDSRGRRVFNLHQLMLAVVIHRVLSGHPTFHQAILHLSNASMFIVQLRGCSQPLVRWRFIITIYSVAMECVPVPVRVPGTSCLLTQFNKQKEKCTQQQW